MGNYILREVEKLIKRFRTRDPFEIIECLGINLKFDFNLVHLKGYYHIINRERYIVINGNLSEQEQLLVAAHELGHDRLHKHLAKVSPMKDLLIYDMTSKPEYESNIFASELLIEDEQIIGLASTEEMGFLSMCSNLSLNPNIVAFKLYSMIQKGYQYNLPQNINSKFLGNRN